jgi:hypothetical protein
MFRMPPASRTNHKCSARDAGFAHDFVHDLAV